MKDFIWFTKHSWSYMKGQRKEFIMGFLGAWKTFHKSIVEDKATQL